MDMREYHHIDSSVYLKAIDDANLTFQYLNKLGRTFKCGISVIILGEITDRISKIFAKDKETRDGWLGVLGDFLTKQKIKVFTVHKKDIDLFYELREIETRAHEPELIALSTAIGKKADVFMTYDEDLLQSSPRFKREYKIKVRNRPSRLLQPSTFEASLSCGGSSQELQLLFSKTHSSPDL